MSVYLGKEKIGIGIKSGIQPKGEIELTTNGKHDVTDYATAVVNVVAKPPIGDYFVKVIDYDGTILKDTNLNNGDTFELPTPPSHDGLVFQEWSCSQDIVDNVITIADNDVMVGATYTTASGLSEFDIELTKPTGLNVTLNMDGTKDWGDGISDDLTTHTYTDYGKYTIKCDGTTMSTSSAGGLFNQTSSAINYYCVKVRLGSNVTSIGSYAFAYCYSLVSATVPNTVTTIGTYAFYITRSFGNGFVIPSGVARNEDYCYAYFGKAKMIVIPKKAKVFRNNLFYLSNLEYTVIPNGTTAPLRYSFSNCKLKKLTLPSSITSLNEPYILTSTTIEEITIPSGVTSIGTDCFANTYTLNTVKILGTPKINSRAFENCYSVMKYDFSQCTGIPNLLYTTAFTGINKIAKIIVPDDLYDSWIVATNWATYSNYIYKASEVQ